jgi:hemerythrin-like metal-binding protein
MHMGWNDADNVGVPELDLQHQRIFNVLLSLNAHPDAATDSEIVADALDELTRYGDAHFRAEEALLRAERYPHLDEQLEGHRQFRRVVAELCFATSAGADNVPALLRTFLGAWWEEHIRGADRRYAAFLRERART